MERAVRRWCDSHSIGIDHAAIAIPVRKLLKSYTIYGSMLLVPPDSIDSDAFKTLFDAQTDSVIGLYELIAKELKITHIAINRPIPTHNDSGSALIENVMRAPINFQPVCGDFGPTACSPVPSRSDFDQAYWVTARQNGIAQTWAPRWTMFSRGNITEKARVLGLQSVADAVEQGRRDGGGCSVVDLYAGVGYFTFSYVKAGVSKVLCWELNAWSCEGLRKGAKANRWQIATIADESVLKEAYGRESIVLFNESNELALSRIEMLRQSIPPIRHVNCGLLPTSQPSWSIAYACLDPLLGGWVHVHENFATDEINDKARSVCDAFQAFLDEEVSPGRVAVLEYVKRVKTYAPGVWHCVVDIMIPPRSGD